MSDQEKAKKDEEEAAAKKAEEEATAKKKAEEAAGNVVDIEDARKKGGEAATAAAKAHATEVNELCTLAGKPEMAGKLIAEDTSVEDVRKALLDARAKDAEDEVNSRHAGGGGGVPVKMDTASDIYARRAGR